MRSLKRCRNPRVRGPSWSRVAVAALVEVRVREGRGERCRGPRSKRNSYPVSPNGRSRWPARRRRCGAYSRNDPVVLPLTGSLPPARPIMPTTADLLVDTLIAWDVQVIFGLPGDGINGIMEALRKRQDKISFIQARHEESAAFMACAYAKWTGRLGVCLATSGPGGTHLLTGLYDAKLDQAPVLAITGMQFHDLIETFTQQDVDLTRVFNDVAAYNAHVADAAHVENVTSLACRTALSRRGVAHLSVANDIQEQDAAQAKRSKRNRPAHTPHELFRSAAEPDDEQLRK